MAIFWRPESEIPRVAQTPDPPGGIGPVSEGLIAFIVGLAAMIGIVSGFILSDTSNILHHYRTDQYVAASLALFASVLTFAFVFVWNGPTCRNGRSFIWTSQASFPNATMTIYEFPARNGKPPVRMTIVCPPAMTPRYDARTSCCVRFEGETKPGARIAAAASRMAIST